MKLKSRDINLSNTCRSIESNGNKSFTKAERNTNNTNYYRYARPSTAVSESKKNNNDIFSLNTNNTYNKNITYQKIRNLNIHEDYNKSSIKNNKFGIITNISPKYNMDLFSYKNKLTKLKEENKNIISEYNNLKKYYKELETFQINTFEYYNDFLNKYFKEKVKINTIEKKMYYNYN